MSHVPGYSQKAEQVDPSQGLARLRLPDDGCVRGALGMMYDYYDQHGLVGNPLVLQTSCGR
jgi:hypothetical protein